MAQRNSSVAETLSKLVDESFHRPYLDRDAVAMLSDAAGSLHHLPDTASLLREAAYELRNLGDYATILHSASDDLQHLQHSTEKLLTAGRKLDNIDRYTYTLTNMVDNLATAASRLRENPVETNSQNQRRESPKTIPLEDLGKALHATGYFYDGHTRNWQYFRWGLAVGVATVILMIIAFLIYQNSAP